MIKSIIFDLGNVLFTFNRKQLLANFVKGDDGRLEKAIFNEWLLRDAGRISDEDFLFHLKVKLDSSEYVIAEKLLHGWIDKLPFDNRMYEFMKEAAKNGTTLYALSNIPKDFAERSKQIKQMQVFCDCVFSSVEKIMKPDKAIFIRAIEKFRVNAGETLYVDDTEENLIAASDCGLKTFLYQNNLGELKNYYYKNKD